jgi:hypothetical protein
LPFGTTIDRIVVEKSARKLSVFRDGNRIKTYRIALGRRPLGAKQEEGDMKRRKGSTRSMAEIRKAVFISRCTFLIHRMKTINVRLHAEFRRVMTS